MIRNCEICNREYSENQRCDTKRRFNTCSEYCRTVCYKKIRLTKQIESGLYHTMRVQDIENLGYDVLVTLRGKMN